MSNDRRRLLAVLLACATLCSGPAWADGSADIPARTVGAFRALFNGQAGVRPVHTKGVVAQGVFTPAPEAAALTTAPQYAGSPVPIVMRLSNFMGLPANPDGGPLAAPHGMAIKFLLDGRDTDIVAHSYNGFPAANPADFLAFLQALTAAGNEAGPGKAALDDFLAGHPAAQQFLNAPEPAPVSYANEAFYGVNAFGFVHGAATRFGRYMITPVLGDARLSAAAAQAAPADYLQAELATRLVQRPGAQPAVEWRLQVQLANPDDPIEDGTKLWPASRPVVTLGTLRITGLVSDDAALVQSLFFTPLNLTEGIIPSDDPMLLARTRAYSISVRERMR